MPIYEFRCTVCDKIFEVDRPRSQAGAPAKCRAATCRSPKKRPQGGAPGRRVWGAAIITPGGNLADQFPMPETAGMGGGMGGMGGGGGDDFDMDF